MTYLIFGMYVAAFLETPCALQLNFLQHTSEMLYLTDVQ